MGGCEAESDEPIGAGPVRGDAGRADARRAKALPCSLHIEVAVCPGGAERTGGLQPPASSVRAGHRGAIPRRCVDHPAMSPMYRALLLLCLAGCASARNTPRAADTLAVEPLGIVRFDPMPPGQRRQLLDATTAAHARWLRSRPQSYELRVVEVGPCFEIRTTEPQPPRRPVYLIAGDSIIGQRPGVIADSLDHACWHRWTADSIFAHVFETLANPDRVLDSVVFDPRYGLPLSYVLDRGGHGPSHIVVDRFIVVPDSAPPPDPGVSDHPAVPQPRHHQ